MTYAGRGSDQCNIRLPDGMRDEIAAAAKANGRSMNAEIIARLSADSETLRDKFAGQALASGKLAYSGLTASQIEDRFGPHRIDITPEEIMAANAYRVADAMLAARKGGDA